MAELSTTLGLIDILKEEGYRKAKSFAIRARKHSETVFHFGFLGKVGNENTFSVSAGSWHLAENIY